jgi:cobalt/nickel transport system permease protein
MHQLTRQMDKTDHWLTRLDPRVKLLSFLFLLAMVISCRGFAFPLLLAAVSLALCPALGVRPGLLLVRFAEPLFIAVMVIILKLFCSGSTPLFSLHIAGFEAVGHRDGLMDGLFIASRIFGAVSLTALLGFSTSFTDLMGALAWLRAPRGFIEISLFAWRYLFVLFDDAQVVYAAQKNRLGYAGVLRGVRSFGTLAGTLVIKAFDNSQSIAVAMAQRGYDGNMPLLRQKPFRITEILCSIGFLLVMTVFWTR